MGPRGPHLPDRGQAATLTAKYVGGARGAKHPDAHWSLRAQVTSTNGTRLRISRIVLAVARGFGPDAYPSAIRHIHLSTIGREQHRPVAPSI